MNKNPTLSLGLTVMFLLGCGGSSGSPGTLRVTAYGEAFIEEGIPSRVFSDGWSAVFGKFLISLGDVHAARGAKLADLTDATYRVFDLHKASQGAGHDLVEAEVPAGHYDNVGFTVAAPPGGTTGGNADAADRDFMIQQKYAIYWEGTFTKGSVTKTAKLGFGNKTIYARCESTAKIDGGMARSQLTFHADHFLYDDLFSSAPNTSFDLIAAADANQDDTITPAELEAVDLRTQERYQVGSTGIADLWSFVVYQSATIGHIDGEGHCHDAIRE